MIVFPDSSVETEYTDPNGSVWDFNGTGWVRQCDCDGSGGDGSGSGDPDWGSVELLINGEEGLTDSTGKNTIIVNGDVSISNSEVKYGAGSLDLTQTGGHLSVENSAHLDVPFTIECWFFPTRAYTSVLISEWLNRDRGFSLRTLNNTQDIAFTVSHVGGQNTDGSISTGHITYDINAWNHAAVTWDGYLYRIFLNGKLGNSYSSNLPPYRGTADLTIGARVTTPPTVGEDFLGYLDDIRITRGVCRYTGDFEPPPEHPTGMTKTIYRSIDPAHIQSDSNDADLTNNVTTNVTSEE